MSVSGEAEIVKIVKAAVEYQSGSVSENSDSQNRSQGTRVPTVVPFDGYRGAKLRSAAPMDVAMGFVEKHFFSGGWRLLCQYRGEFYVYNGACYVKVSDEEVRHRLYLFIDNASCCGDGGAVEIIRASRNKVDQALDALKAIVHLGESNAEPCWIGGGEKADPNKFISCANGLLHVPTRELRAHTPSYFSLSSVPYSYDPCAGEPKEFFRFLESLFPGDRASVDLLQEVFGYLLLRETHQQKIFLIVGPPRSGKGTIERLLKPLLGDGNLAEPTLHSLCETFGLEALIGKSLAIVSDARLGDRANKDVALERLLSISGEGGQTINRKHRASWRGRLYVRFLILTNELPNFCDSSGAFASRLVILRLRESFLGREDRDLDAKLAQEMPQILNWALDGWERLTKNGHFTQPEAASDIRGILSDLTSPIKAFAADCCELGAGNSVLRQDLFDRWKGYNEAHGNVHGITMNEMVRQLSAAFPGVRAFHPRAEAGAPRPRYLTGICLKQR